jgi:hypothetical protein
MDEREIVSIIKRRRDFYFGSQRLSSATDPLTHKAGEIAQAVSDEYDSLLREIGAVQTAEAKIA